ncbi:MAG TPA: glutathione S-transferase family protein [Pseudomonadales bacterium]
MKLYHCRDARSLRPLWAVHEMGLDCEVVTLRFPPRVHHPDYLSVNPLGTVPTFIDGETVMTESSAICEYLGRRYGPTDLIVRETEPEFGTYLNWMYRSDATLTFPQTLVLRYTRLEPPERRQPQVAEDYAIWYLSRLRSVEAALTEREYLVADRFTMADITVGYALYLGKTLGLDERYKPNCRGYLARLESRPAFQRALAVTA